jgi:hypothetical protein
MSEDSTDSVSEDIKKLQERIEELKLLIANTEIEYQNARAGITEEEDIAEADKALSRHDKKLRDEERRARWAEEDRKNKKADVDTSKLSAKDRETLGEAKYLINQLFIAREKLGDINREIEVLEGKEKNAGSLSGEDQERLGILRDR